MNKIQRAAERHLVDVLVRMILRRGYTICVDSGGDEYDLQLSSTPSKIVEAVYAVDSATLVVMKTPISIMGKIVLVLGNSPEEVVADYSTLGPVPDIIDHWTAAAEAVTALLEQWEI